MISRHGGAGRAAVSASLLVFLVGCGAGDGGRSAPSSVKEVSAEQIAEYEQELADWEQATLEWGYCLDDVEAAARRVADGDLSGLNITGHRSPAGVAASEIGLAARREMSDNGVRAAEALILDSVGAACSRIHFGADNPTPEPEYPTATATALPPSAPEPGAPQPPSPPTPTTAPPAPALPPPPSPAGGDLGCDEILDQVGSEGGDLQGTVWIALEAISDGRLADAACLADEQLITDLAGAVDDPTLAACGEPAYNDDALRREASCEFMSYSFTAFSMGVSIGWRLQGGSWSN